MTTPCYPSALWPEGSQLLILKASMLEGEDAHRAFLAWRDSTVFDDLDHASFRMLPMLRWNIARLEIRDPISARLDSVTRFLRVETAMKRNALKRILQTLEASGIEAILLKGASVGLQYYPHPSLRPMADCDLLVRHDDRDRALEALAGDGWFSASGASDTHHYSSDLFRKEFPSLKTELHWRSGIQAKLSEDRTAWKHSRQISFEGVRCRAFRPEIEIIHACRHGYNWTPEVPPMRWLMDCAMIISRSPSPIDWEFLADMARGWEESLAVLETVSWIRREFGAEIPDAALRWLEGNRVGVRERKLHHLKAIPRDWKICARLYTAYLARELPIWRWVFQPRVVLGYFAAQFMIPDHSDVIRFFLYHFWRESEASRRIILRRLLKALLLAAGSRRIFVRMISDRFMARVEEPNGICWQKRRVEFRGFAFPLDGSAPSRIRLRLMEGDVASDLPSLIDQHSRVDLPPFFPDHPAAKQSGFSIIANIPENRCHLRLECGVQNGWETVCEIEIR